MQRERKLNEKPFMFFYAMKVKPDVLRCFQVLHPFVITLATLEMAPDENSSAVVSLWYRAPLKDKLLLCTLTPDHPQQVLELFFFTNDVVTLYTCGQGTVNLLGKAQMKRSRATSSDQILTSSGQHASVKSTDDDDDDESDESWHPDERQEASSELSSDGSQDNSTESESMSVESEADDADTNDQEESEEVTKPEGDSKDTNSVSRFSAINSPVEIKKKCHENKESDEKSSKKESRKEKKMDQNKIKKQKTHSKSK